MAYGQYDGKDISDPELRKYFDRANVINSDWYKERLKLKQVKDIRFYDSQITYLENFIANPNNATLVENMNIKGRLKKIKDLYEHVNSKSYLENLIGTIGADPLFKK